MKYEPNLVHWGFLNLDLSRAFDDALTYCSEMNLCHSYRMIHNYVRGGFESCTLGSFYHLDLSKAFDWLHIEA